MGEQIREMETSCGGEKIIKSLSCPRSQQEPLTEGGSVLANIPLRNPGRGTHRMVGSLSPLRLIFPFSLRSNLSEFFWVLMSLLIKDLKYHNFSITADNHFANSFRSLALGTKFLKEAFCRKSQTDITLSGFIIRPYNEEGQ